MGLRYQSRVTLFPGVRLNFSGSGISASFGVRGASVTVGPRGTSLNLGIPGTGISYHQSLTPLLRHPEQHPPTPILLDTPAPAPASGAEPERGRHLIQSADVSQVTSDGLLELKRLILQVTLEREHLRGSIPLAERRLAKARGRLRRAKSWYLGWLLKKKIPEREAAVGAAAEELKSQQDRLSGAFIEAEFLLDVPTKESFENLGKAFEQLAGSACIWEILSDQRENRNVTRSFASRKVERTLVTFGIEDDAVLQTDGKVLRLRNAVGADLLVYPGFILMPSDQDLALIDLRDVLLQSGTVQFMETDAVPPDATIVSYTWAKVNKDGSRDKRFSNNYQIPVAEYGQVGFKSKKGLNVEYEVSNRDHAVRFGRAFVDHQNKLRALASQATHSQLEKRPVSAVKAPGPLAKGPPGPAAVPAAGSAPAVPFAFQSVQFLRSAEALSMDHAVEVLEQFATSFKQEANAVSGEHPVSFYRDVVRETASMPGAVHEFLHRTPGFAPRSASAINLIRLFRSLAVDVVGQILGGIEKAPASDLADPDVQKVLAEIRETERGLRH